jgi:abortive infection bacteriophage resistance protein
MYELKEHQSALDLDGQIDNLNKIGLVIGDPDYAKRILNDISYFRLIKAFGLGLKPRNGVYKGVTFEQIVRLYNFNCNLRQLIFPAIEVIEINLRCRVANYFSTKYGCFGYKDSQNFSSASFHAEFIEDIAAEVSRNKRSPYISNFQNNYIDGGIPLYALVELFSFGMLSKFYKNMKNEDKKEVAKTFGIGYTYLESWIESIAFVRNICAHYGRLYNAKLTKAPILYSQYSGISNYRIFGVLLCIKHILNGSKSWDEVSGNLISLMEKYDEIELDKMGFPENWLALLDVD